jgi:Utp14 protein
VCSALLPTSGPFVYCFGRAGQCSSVYFYCGVILIFDGPFLSINRPVQLLTQEPFKDFESLKKREVEADAPHEEDRTLPGWVCLLRLVQARLLTAELLNRAPGEVPASDPTQKPNKIIKKVAGIDPELRADHGKAHVIISEKKDKKAAKYLTKDLPYPYTSKAQFEKSMEIPVGTEWNTQVGFQRQTLPRVVKKVCTGWRAVFRLLTPYVGQMGTVIDPLEFSF